MQDQPSSGEPMTKRMTISVDDDVYEMLELWANEEVRTPANLAAALVTLAIRDRQKQQNGSKQETHD